MPQRAAPGFWSFAPAPTSIQTRPFARTVVIYTGVGSPSPENGCKYRWQARDERRPPS